MPRCGAPDPRSSSPIVWRCHATTRRHGRFVHISRHAGDPDAGRHGLRLRSFDGARRVLVHQGAPARGGPPPLDSAVPSTARGGARSLASSRMGRRPRFRSRRASPPGTAARPRWDHRTGAVRSPGDQPAARHGTTAVGDAHRRRPRGWHGRHGDEDASRRGRRHLGSRAHGDPLGSRARAGAGRAARDPMAAGGTTVTPFAGGRSSSRAGPSTGRGGLGAGPYGAGCAGPLSPQSAAGDGATARTLRGAA